MQQFTVPQFIDVEDKIFGPITSRQFVIMLSGFIVIGICYKLFDFSLFLTVAVLIFFMAGIIAFLKINGMPFHFFVLNFIQTSKRPFLRVWNNAIGRDAPTFEEDDIKISLETIPVQNKLFNNSRLTELSLIVDTQGAYKGEGGSDKMTKIKSVLDIKN